CRHRPAPGQRCTGIDAGRGHCLDRRAVLPCSGSAPAEGRDMSVLELQGLGVELHGRLLLDDIDLCLQPGEMLGLIGPNGAGKSTVLKAIAHLLPYQGEIRLGGLSLARLAPRERALRLAYLGQGDVSGWPLRLRDYVALGR